jgi:hypothetical protein
LLIGRAQVIILAFLLRGFRQKQSLPNSILLTLSCLIVQQIFGHQLQQRSDWLALALGILLVLLSTAFLGYRHSVTLAASSSPVLLLNEIPEEEDCIQPP